MVNRRGENRKVVMFGIEEEFEIYFFVGSEFLDFEN